MKDFLNRLNEPSSYAGGAAIAYGLDKLNIFNEAPAVAQVLEQTGQAVAAGATGGPIGALLALGFGLASIFMREKGDK